jgi:hypothetical protein
MFALIFVISRLNSGGRLIVQAEEAVTTMDRDEVQCRARPEYWSSQWKGVRTAERNPRI